MGADSQKELRKEEGCFAWTAERKYYKIGEMFIKRSLRPREFKMGYRGLHCPRLGKERLANEAASIHFLREVTNIPIPKLYGGFEDDGAFYLITEYIDGVGMSDLSDEQKEIVSKEIATHLETLHKLTSKRIGGPSGIVIPPYRVTRKTENDVWVLLESQIEEYVFCHNDLSQQNIIVDPETLKIKAIIDWEYAGFYPKFFESPFYRRLGPSSAINDEKDDSDELLSFLSSHSIESGLKTCSTSYPPECLADNSIPEQSEDPTR